MMIDLEQLKADREAGTDGPWHLQHDDEIWSKDDLYVGMVGNTKDTRRIARLPELETAYIEAVAKLDKAVEALIYYAKDHEVPDEGPWGIGSDDFGNTALDALALITTKPERGELWKRL